MSADLYKAVIQFEKDHHNDVFRWICKRSLLADKPGQLEICDFSMDSSIFGQEVALRMKAKRLAVIVRHEKQPPVFVADANLTIDQLKVDLTGETYEGLQTIGQYDLIILKEMLYEIKNLSEFFNQLKSCLKSPSESKVFCLTRPKNPPLPLPDTALAIWRKMAPTREEIIEAAEKVRTPHQACLLTYFRLQLIKA